MVEVVGPGSVVDVEVEVDVDVVDVVVEVLVEVLMVVGSSVVVTSTVGTWVLGATTLSGPEGGVVGAGFESPQPATTRMSDASRTPPRTAVTAVR